MEAASAGEEEQNFRQLSETRQSGVEHNTTEGGNQVAWLNADRGRILGPNRTQEIFEGDSVKLSVFGKYETNSTKPNISAYTVASAAEKLTGDFGVIARSGSLNPATLLGIVDLIGKDLQKKKTPEACMGYAVYDSDSVLNENED